MIAAARKSARSANVANLEGLPPEVLKAFEEIATCYRYAQKSVQRPGSRLPELNLIHAVQAHSDELQAELLELVTVARSIGRSPTR